MTHLHKLRIARILEWASSNSVDSYKIPIWSAGSLFYTGNNPRFYRRKRVVQTVNGDNFDEHSINDGQSASKFSNAVRKQAQAALIEYLHSTRSLQFADAEHMSKNSPNFLVKLLQRIDTGADVGRSVTRFLRYHPINEYEPFFESSGLRAYEYKSLLPRDLMFLSDNDLLLENYHVLCNYGIPRNKIGKIYKEAGEIFQYDCGVLALKLQAYEKMGFDRSFIAKMVVCSPYHLIGERNVEFIKSVEILKKVGIRLSWIEEHLSEKSSHNWSQSHVLLDLFSNSGYSEEQLRLLINQHPGILFEGSGDRALAIIGFMLKFGSSMNQICSMFLQFPPIQVWKFNLNLRQCFLFLTEIEMEGLEIGKIIRSHPLLLGSCTLKKTNSLLSALNVGKKRLCDIILQNPQEMKNWVMGSKVGKLPNSGERLRSKTLKKKFLLDLGFSESSNEMEKALKVFRGKGAELQERFDCIMQAGLVRKDVCEMVRIAPQILNQKKEVIKMKIDFIINDLGYPISALVTYPAFLSYTIPTIKLRIGMYNWLKDQGKVDPMLSLSTIIGISDKLFVKRYVELDPRGSEVWLDLKKNITSE
ncbi:hypothetical protein JCGZ_25523 [Jatropha curcas]|uniref:Uncharacterized protein n=1 Tax=Jatropha curcas TaxID=180498 RepID=A0A067JL30_JATCU|nr:transcription termination factor MTEF18, mitochondrial [Jatropha curcas]XP_020539960.1 transcription termination factor MTEF18, mitochondrial [Jatropha curcas]XP_020539961.1 transcription termination factor MTEF18, mitochondrial [Jatropha curcas]XP_020539962.1 transcription termination factor MTEF18, mitochondrial [Jatropha curcas]XP_020539963.1 transcription termination factor MTEF18, mitochondrial [Jatropha curcas]XP_020539964.1 transcription termination factor MTEF18, mitochondrial [Jatr